MQDFGLAFAGKPLRAAPMIVFAVVLCALRSRQSWERFKHARDAVVLEIDLKLDYLVGEHDYSLGTHETITDR